MGADDDELVGETTEFADKFYRGTIRSLRRGTGRGTIRTAGGRDIPFVFQFVTMVGPYQRFDDLREGQSVGYDVSWTSHGLRVSMIQIPD